MNMIKNTARKFSSFKNIKYQEGLSKVNIRENRSYGKDNRVKAIKKFYDMTRKEMMTDKLRKANLAFKLGKEKWFI